MDHHCPWTANCVSEVTFPHFFRFLVYAVLAMIQLEYMLCARVAVIWGNRQLPSVGSQPHLLGPIYQRDCSEEVVPVTVPWTKPISIHTSFPARHRQFCYVVRSLHSLRPIRMVFAFEHHDYRGLGNRSTSCSSAKGKGTRRVCVWSRWNQSQDGEARVSI